VLFDKYISPSAEKLGNGGRYCSQRCCLIANRSKGDTTRTFAVRERNSGPNNSAWKGDKATIGAIHKWIVAHKGKATRCEECGAEDTKIEWSNVDHSYHREINEYRPLCVRCHKGYDRTSGIRKGDWRNRVTP